MELETQEMNKEKEVFFPLPIDSFFSRSHPIPTKKISKQKETLDEMGVEFDKSVAG